MVFLISFFFSSLTILIYHISISFLLVFCLSPILGICKNKAFFISFVTSKSFNHSFNSSYKHHCIAFFKNQKTVLNVSEINFVNSWNHKCHLSRKWNQKCFEWWSIEGKRKQTFKKYQIHFNVKNATFHKLIETDLFTGWWLIYLVKSSLPQLSGLSLTQQTVCVGLHFRQKNKCFQAECAMISNWFQYLLYHHFVLQT